MQYHIANCLSHKLMDMYCVSYLYTLIALALAMRSETDQWKSMFKTPISLTVLSKDAKDLHITNKQAYLKSINDKSAI